MLVTLTRLTGVFSLTQSCPRNTCADHGFLSFCKKDPRRITVKRIILMVINCLTDAELSSHLRCFLS